jgi:hypothetical protein
MVTSVTKGGTQKFPKKFNKIVETYWHDHSLETSSGTFWWLHQFFDLTIMGEQIFLKKPVIFVYTFVVSHQIWSPPAQKLY